MLRKVLPVAVSIWNSSIVTTLVINTNSFQKQKAFMQLYRSDNKFQITQDFLGPAETFLLNCRRSVFYSLIWVSASAPKTQFQLRLESLVANCVFIGACDRTGDSTAQNWAVVFLSSGQLVEKRMTGDSYDNPTANSKCAGESSQRKFQHIKSKHELQSHDGMSEAHSGCFTAPCPRRFLLLFPQFSVFVSCLIYVWNNKNIPRVPLLFRLPVLSSRFSPPHSLFLSTDELSTTLLLVLLVRLLNPALISSDSAFHPAPFHLISSVVSLRFPSSSLHLLHHARVRLNSWKSDNQLRNSLIMTYIFKSLVMCIVSSEVGFLKRSSWVRCAVFHWGRIQMLPDK